MDSSRLMVYVIEYCELFFEEDSDDKWGWVRGKIQKEYFDDECKFNQKITDIEDNYDDYEITAIYSGEIYKTTR